MDYGAGVWRCFLAVQYVVIWDGSHLKCGRRRRVATVEQIDQHALTQHIFYWGFSNSYCSASSGFCLKMIDI